MPPALPFPPPEFVNDCEDFVPLFGPIKEVAPPVLLWIPIMLLRWVSIGISWFYKSA